MGAGRTTGRVRVQAPGFRKVRVQAPGFWGVRVQAPGFRRVRRGAVGCRSWGWNLGSTAVRRPSP